MTKEPSAQGRACFSYPPKVAEANVGTKHVPKDMGAGGDMGLKAPTEDQIRAMTAQQRAVLYENAKRRASEGGQQIVDFIEAIGLPLSDGDMLSSDPDYLEMERIIWSPEGRVAAVDAVEQGLPALAGVDPLIRAALGERYHPHNAGTINAGFITAALMRHLGYVEAGSGAFPGGVAKTGMKWKKQPSPASK